MVSLAASEWTGMYADRVSRMGASEIRELLKVLDQPDMISFAGGIPDPALFPTESIKNAYVATLEQTQLGGQSLQYSVSEGYLPLRRWIAEYMTSLGATCEPDNIVITSGSQQGLDYLGKLFLSPGDTALVEAPTYLGALQAFNPYEPNYASLTFNADSVQCGEIPTRASMAYVVSDFANPTGESLSEGQRSALLGLVADLGVPLIEDAAYEALRFEGERIPSCLALDIRRRGSIDASSVIYCGTFSKTISPGLRVGWICAARDLIQKIVLTKQASDLHSPTLNQMVMHQVVEEIYPEQVERIKTVYAQRRKAMLNALSEYLPDGVTWTEPAGGMFVWVTLPVGMDAKTLLESALTEERVAFVPGGAFFADGSGKNTLRLSYSLPPEAVITEGISRLGRLITRNWPAPI
jgi:DNA-binding transcriptional MocR family regulator